MKIFVNKSLMTRTIKLELDFIEFLLMRDEFQLQYQNFNATLKNKSITSFNN